MSETLLITGFDPFGGESINPAWEAAKCLPKHVGKYDLCALQVPTVFGEASRFAMAKAEEVHPSVILCIGQAGGRAAVTPEMIGINLRYASIPDNAGNRPQDVPCVQGGPDAYFSTLPVRRMAQAIADIGISAAVSCTAGTFVCNDLLYCLLHRCHDTQVRCGFIHVPYLPEQAKNNQPSMALCDIVRALRAAIEAL